MGRTIPRLAHTAKTKRGVRTHSHTKSKTMRPRLRPGPQFLGGLLNKADLDVCPSVPTYIRTSVCPSTESFSDSNEIWCVGRDQWLMHDGMPYGPIQGQGQGHVALKVINSSIFKICLLRHFHESWQMTADCLTREQYLNLITRDFWCLS